mgnify:CR=1 FL=1
MRSRAVRSYTFGIYPRPVRLIAATRRDPEGSREMARRESSRIIELQRRAGLSLLSDPLLEWDDMLRWFAAEWEGMEVDGILRYFEHNAFYRVPVVKGKLRTDGGVLRRHTVLRERGASTLEVPEPFTFAYMSRDMHYGSVEALALDVARALNSELCSLEGELSPSIIVVKGPALLWGDSRSAEVAAKASWELLNSCRAPGILQLYFRSPVAAYRALRELRTAYSGFGLDATWDPPGSLAEELKGYRMGVLALGLVSSQNTRMERPSDVAAAAQALAKAAGGPETMLTVSSDLEFLPYSFATRKLRVLGRAARRA